MLKIVPSKEMVDTLNADISQARKILPILLSKIPKEERLPFLLELHHQIKNPLVKAFLLAEIAKYEKKPFSFEDKEGFATFDFLLALAEENPDVAETLLSLMASEEQIRTFFPKKEEGILYLFNLAFKRYKYGKFILTIIRMLSSSEEEFYDRVERKVKALIDYAKKGMLDMVLRNYGCSPQNLSFFEEFIANPKLKKEFSRWILSKD